MSGACSISDRVLEQGLRLRKKAQTRKMRLGLADRSGEGRSSLLLEARRLEALFPQPTNLHLDR